VPYTLKELKEIQQKYERGELDHIKKDLEKFIIAHKHEIKKYKEKLKKYPSLASINDEIALKLYILQHRTINPPREMQEQLEEIKKETWIEGEKTKKTPDEEKVAIEWAKKYAPGWRCHRVTTIIFVFEQDKKRYLSLLE
jgi:hypothetical protein